MPVANNVANKIFLI